MIFPQHVTCFREQFNGNDCQGFNHSNSRSFVQFDLIVVGRLYYANITFQVILVTRAETLATEHKRKSTV